MVVLMHPRIPPAGAAALAASMFAILTTAGHSQTPARRVITVVAERFSFTPSEITVDAGEEVELRLKSDDTAHGFRIAGVVNVTVPKRGHDPLAVTIGPLVAGRYPFECSRVCGAGHNFMRGMLIVRDKTSGGAR
jgi:cytochrome c oxidase subunit II